MSDEKTEEPWKQSLKSDIECVIGLNQDCGGAEGVYALRDKVMAAVMPHMESSYKVGRMKATARIGRRYVTRNLELSRKLRLIREAIAADNGAVQSFYRVAEILGEDEGASEAEAEIRKKTLLEAADVIDHIRATMLAPPSAADRYAIGLGAAAGELRRLVAGGS